MDTQPLFLDKPMTFGGEEKLAGMMTRMSDNVDNWQQEIMQAAYKQCPCLSEFTPSVVLDKIDEERGYAFGSIEVRPKSAMTVEERKESGLGVAHIPIIIKEQMLSPFDIFLSGKKYHHLTEARLREALFRPEPFDVARMRPFDPSLINELQPPLRAGYGGFGGGGTKLGSAEIEKLPLLPMLHGQVNPEHVERLKTAMQDESLKTAVVNADPGVIAAFRSALGLTATDLQKTAQVVTEKIKPTVVQLTKLGSDRVLVKWANGEFFSPQQEEVPMAVAQDLAGDADMIQQLEADGTITVSPDAAIKETMELEEIKVADSFGLWKVQDSTGNSMIGWVFPQLLSMDLQPLPLSLFNNGSQHCVQEHIAGMPAGKSTDLPKGVPQGYGTLYYIDHGTAKAFVPMNVQSTLRTPAGLRYQGQDDLGQPVTFSFGEGLKVPVKIGENEYVVPTTFNWMPLRGKAELVSEPAMFSKLGSKQTARVGIVGDRSGVFSFRGPAIAKVAEANTKFIDHDKAMFLGVALGMEPGFCKQALARAQKGELVQVGNLRELGSVPEKMAGIRVKIAQELAELDPPIHNYFLAKEAAVLDDALTADKILGLGFLNAENVSTFVDLLPSLESASSKLAEMLVAVRIGLKEVPEVAVERMLVAMEDVLRGLRSLQQRDSAPGN
jgi:hypothetical protein